MQLFPLISKMQSEVLLDLGLTFTNPLLKRHYLRPILMKSLVPNVELKFDIANSTTYRFAYNSRKCFGTSNNLLLQPIQISKLNEFYVRECLKDSSATA